MTAEPTEVLLCRLAHAHRLPILTSVSWRGVGLVMAFSVGGIGDLAATGVLLFFVWFPLPPLLFFTVQHNTLQNDFLNAMTLRRSFSSLL